MSDKPLTERLTNEFTQCSKSLANSPKVYDFILFSKLFKNFLVLVVIFVNFYLILIIERHHLLAGSSKIKVAFDIKS